MTLKKTNFVTKLAESKGDINATCNIIHLIDPSIDFEKLTCSDIDKYGVFIEEVHATVLWCNKV